MSNILKVGDKVLWRGSFGSADKHLATIESIDINCNGCKEGDEVEETEWANIHGRNSIHSLDNGHWCWGEQLSVAPLTTSN
jgi:hypothetical protein